MTKIENRKNKSKNNKYVTEYFKNLPMKNRKIMGKSMGKRRKNGRKEERRETTFVFQCLLFLFCFFRSAVFLNEKIEK